MRDFVILEGKFQLLAHEIQVALDGFPIHLEFASEGAAIRKPAPRNQFVDAQYALERTPGPLGPDRFFFRHFRQLNVSESGFTDEAGQSGI